MPFRGGSFLNGAQAGVFALNLNEPRSNSWNNAGFRSALFQSKQGLDLYRCLFVVVLSGMNPRQACSPSI